MRLQNKIILALIPLIVAPLLALGWISYVQLHETTERKTLDEARKVMGHIQQNLDALWKTAFANIELFAGSSLVEKYMLNTNEWNRYTVMQRPILRLFASYQQAYPSYQEIRILSPDGYEDTRSTTTFLINLTEEEGGTAYFQAMARYLDDHFAVFTQNPDTGGVSLYVSKRIKLRDRSKDPIASPEILRGYLIITVDTSMIEAMVSSQFPGKHGIFYIVDAQGQVLFHPDRERRYSRISGSLMNRVKGIAIQRTAARVVMDERSQIFLSDLLVGGLMLIAEIPEADLMEASAGLRNAVATITLLTILIVATLLIVFLRHTLVKPILELRHAAQEIGRGNLDFKIKVDSEDEVGELARSFQEMGYSLQKSNDQIKYLAYHDNLTGLPNRLMLGELLSHLIHNAQRENYIVALLFVDLDNFKRINDTLGHHAGDEMLQQCADRLTHCVRGEDYVVRNGSQNISSTVARLGGDEFMIILPNIKDPYVAAMVANRILKAVSQPFSISQHEFFVGASIGITTFPHDGDNVESLIKNADVAMYHAKEQGKNNYMYYSSSMNAAALERLTMESSLRRALERDELVLHYQPQVDAKTERITGIEALVRWQHPERGLIPPGIFISMAEENGLIIPIGEWVLQKACTDMNTWRKRGIDDLTVSVNLSAQQFRAGHLDSVIDKILSDTGLPPQFLDVELTESSIMTSEVAVEEVLNGVKKLGASISLDDFGTGYSSLSYLRRFPIDTLKIDRSFVRDITTDHNDAPIIQAIIAMAHSLGLRVVAEGVETPGQLEFLRAHNCNIIQGFLFCRPLPAEEIDPLLRNRRILRSA